MSVQETRESIRDFKQLLESRGWAKLVEIAREQIAVRRDVICLTPLRSLEEVPETEFKKGEAAGIDLFVKLPQAILDDLIAELQNIEEKDDE